MLDALVNLCNLFWIEVEHDVAKFKHPSLTGVFRSDDDVI